MKVIKMFCMALAVCLLAGCGMAETSNTQIANPWQDYETLQQAEKAVGFDFGLPQETEDGSAAQQFRVLEGWLLEVIYRQGDRSITVRKAVGSEDISGDNNQYGTVTLADYANGSATIKEDKCILVFTDEYAWSVFCADGLGEEQIQQWIESILKA